MFRVISNTSLFVFSSVFCLLLLEVGVRFVLQSAPELPADELPWFRRSAAAAREFRVDPELGFVPVIGGAKYDQFGTLRKPDRIKYSSDKNQHRVLFIGDSVTRRQKITKPLEAFYSQDEFAFWNAGVTSFNTSQELSFYRRYNYRVAPDTVLLFFHLNDFETTPVAFRDQSGSIVVYSPHAPAQRINRYLMLHSYLYRMYLRATLSRKKNPAEFVPEVRDSLKEFRDLLSSEGINFNLVILPILKPYQEWSMIEKASYQSILSIVAQLNIASFDLLEIMNEALRDGITVQEAPGDHWHPSVELGARFAKYLFEERLINQPS